MKARSFTSRRGFLAKSGLAAAAVSMPHIARAQGASGDKLRIGIIGCGDRSNNVGDMALKDGRYEIVSLADYLQDAVDRQGEKFKVPANRRFTGLNCFKRLIDAGRRDGAMACDDRLRRRITSPVPRQAHRRPRTAESTRDLCQTSRQ